MSDTARALAVQTLAVRGYACGVTLEERAARVVVVREKKRKLALFVVVEGLTLQVCADRLGVSMRTAKRWLAELQQKGRQDGDR